MKVFLVILAAIVLGGSFYADYRWRKWMAARKSEHDDFHRPR